MMLAAVPPADAKQIGTGNGTSFASASGNAKRPKKLSLEIAGSLNQGIEVSWGVSCTGEDFKFNSRTGTFAGQTPINRTLPVPLRRPQKCSVNVSASQSDFFVDPFSIAITLFASAAPRRALHRIRLIG